MRKVKKKRLHLMKKKFLFHQDDAPAQSSAVFSLFELCCEILPHPSLLTTLSTFELLFVSKFEEVAFVGKRFARNDEVIAETSEYFEDLDKSYYKDGIEKLEHRWTKYIDLKGDYVEKLKRFFL